MAKSRITGLGLALAVAAPVPAAAQGQSSAEAMISEQQKGLQAAIGTRRCRAGGSDGDGEIVVCGQAASPHRLPLPVDPLPGATVRGEPPSPVALTREETCTNIGQTRGCPSFDILAIGLMIGKVVVEEAVRELIED
jgi:hypothetical protein